MPKGTAPTFWQSLLKRVRRLLAWPRDKARRQRATAAKARFYTEDKPAWWTQVRRALSRQMDAAMPERARRGRDAEAFAAQELTRKGLRIVERNWRAGRDEIDLIAWDGGTLAFIEVRARQQTARAQGVATLTKRKRTALQRAITRYCSQKGYRNWRFDIYTVVLDGDTIRSGLHGPGIKLLQGTVERQKGEKYPDSHAF
ncbi:MAG: YraN family protein [Opitutales bacterium]